jgi:hypothetical protein
VRCREKAEASFSQGDRWKRLISRYIQAMPPMGRMPGPDAQIMACTSFAEINAINANVGEAASPNQPPASRDCRISEVHSLTGIKLVISELPVDLRRYFSALNLTKMYGGTTGDRE